MPLNDEWKKEYADTRSAGEPGGTAVGDGNRWIFRCFAMPCDRQPCDRHNDGVVISG